MEEELAWLIHQSLELNVRYMERGRYCRQTYGPYNEFIDEGHRSAEFKSGNKGAQNHENNITGLMLAKFKLLRCLKSQYTNVAAISKSLTVETDHEV